MAFWELRQIAFRVRLEHPKPFHPGDGGIYLRRRNSKAPCDPARVGAKSLNGQELEDRVVIPIRNDLKTVVSELLVVVDDGGSGIRWLVPQLGLIFFDSPRLQRQFRP